MELGARPARTTDRRPIIADDLAVANTQWDTDAGALDVLVSAAWPHDSTVVYADIRRNAGLVEVGGFVVSAASLDDLILMKEAADRYKDHLALPELRRIRGDRCDKIHTSVAVMESRTRATKTFAGLVQRATLLPLLSGKQVGSA